MCESSNPRLGDSNYWQLFNLWHPWSNFTLPQNLQSLWWNLEGAFLNLNSNTCSTKQCLCPTKKGWLHYKTSLNWIWKIAMGHLIPLAVQTMKVMPLQRHHQHTRFVHLLSQLVAEWVYIGIANVYIVYSCIHCIQEYTLA